jgi:hypothetical protein
LEGIIHSTGKDLVRSQIDIAGLAGYGKRFFSAAFGRIQILQAMVVLALVCLEFWVVRIGD